MVFSGLSTEQAPPIWAPTRFFLTAPIFAIFAGFLIYFSEPSILMVRYSIDAIIITHAMTIGFFGFVMLGALTQMLPVLAGVQIPKVDAISLVAYVLLIVGTVSMLFGLMHDNSTLDIIALSALGIGFGLMITVIGLAIIKVKNFNATVKAMSISLVFSFFTVILGLFLLYTYIDNDYAAYKIIVANIHSIWGIFGFAGILIIGVSFQVLPMFYVAPRFNDFFTKRVVFLIGIGLFIWLLSNIYFQEQIIIAKICVSVFFLAFSVAIWQKLNKRRRPISDVTIWYWRLASISLFLGFLLWMIDEYFDNEYIVIVAIILGGGFVLSIMMGMLYKIIPFLVWFHLNGMGYMSIPTINEMINKNLAKIQFILFVISLFGFIFSFYFDALFQISAIIFILSMAILQYNVIVPMLVYVKVKKTKPDFDMSAFKTI